MGPRDLSLLLVERLKVGSSRPAENVPAPVLVGIDPRPVGLSPSGVRPRYRSWCFVIVHIEGCEHVGADILDHRVG